MHYKLLSVTLLALLAGSMTATKFARAQGYAQPPCCEPGYQIVEEICYREEVCKVCRVVQDVKMTKKAVYECKEVDYCQKGCPGFLHESCGECCDCTDCGCPRTKKVLMKKFITIEEPICKCVVECVTKKVPYTVYHKVPCGACAVPAPASAPAPEPATQYAVPVPPAPR